MNDVVFDIKLLIHPELKVLVVDMDTRNQRYFLNFFKLKSSASSITVYKDRTHCAVKAALEKMKCLVLIEVT
jgi:hypothetical protein